MLDHKIPILLLHSGGRDSTVACIRLLDQGEKVFAITFLHDSSDSAELPKTRAEEISSLYPSYSWAAIDYTLWERGMKAYVQQNLSENLPRSCLICAMARLTAAITICNSIGSNQIAVGYAGYQSDWAEQTPIAIDLQKKYLHDQNIEFLNPTQDIFSKKSVIEELRRYGLTEQSLENPCCVALEGTQFVDGNLVKKVIEICIDFAASEKPKFNVRATVGDRIYATE